MATGTIKNTATPRTGPGSDFEYDPNGALSPGTVVTLIWKEGLWYYVEVPSPLRRNYIHQDYLNISGTVPTVTNTLLTRYVMVASLSRYGSNLSYTSAIFIPRGSTIFYLDGQKQGDYAYVQYTFPNGMKTRVWYLHTNIATAYIGPTAYRFLKCPYNGLDMNIIQVSPSNTKLDTLNRTKSLGTSSYKGINAGFYDLTGTVKTLNIAVQDGIVVGNGGNANGVGSGVIYWTGSTLAYMTAQYSSQISGISSSGTWAQGGISMFLGNSNWATLTISECPIYPVNSTSSGRTAIVANVVTKTVYLIVTNTNPVSMTSFRTAIQSFLRISDGSSDSSTFKGLFLDGSGSSQLKAVDMANATVSLTGDGRNLTQIITV